MKVANTELLYWTPSRALAAAFPFENHADSRAEAMAAFRYFKKTWQPLYPKMVQSLENDLAELLAFFRFPRHLWKKLRTTNVIERSFVEVRRRGRWRALSMSIAWIE